MSFHFIQNACLFLSPISLLFTKLDAIPGYHHLQWKKSSFCFTSFFASWECKVLENHAYNCFPFFSTHLQQVVIVYQPGIFMQRFSSFYHIRDLVLCLGFGQQLVSYNALSALYSPHRQGWNKLINWPGLSKLITTFFSINWNIW